MAQPTQLTPTEQDALVKQIGLAMLRVAPEDWEQLTVDYRAVGRYAESTAQVVFSDGAVESWTMPPDLQGHFARLRGGMYREGRGTWYNARYRLDHPSSYNLEYDREEPVWDMPPPPQAYPDDLRLFPRSEDNVPEWLRRRLATAPPPGPGGPGPGGPPSPRFRVARIFDGPGEDGRPSVNRPHVDEEDIADLLDYLDGAPIVGPARGYDVDRLDPDARQSVPVAFHTDGVWIWPAAVNYYLREHDISPETDLVEHIQRMRFQLPNVDDATRSAAALFLGPPPPGPGGPGPGGPPRPPVPAPTRAMPVPPPGPGPGGPPPRPAGGPPPAALPSQGPPGRTVDQLRARLADLGVPESAFRIGPPAGRAWTMEQTEEGWRVGFYDRAFVAPAMFEDVADASAFLLGKLLLDGGRENSGRQNGVAQPAPAPPAPAQSVPPPVPPPAEPSFDDPPFGEPFANAFEESHTDPDDGYDDYEPPAPPRQPVPQRAPVSLPATMVTQPAERQEHHPDSPGNITTALQGLPNAASTPGAEWPIAPLPGEPPLTLFRGKRVVELEPGTEIDRFGDDDGNLVYAVGTPFQERSLVPEWVERPYHVYRVRQPIQALTGAAIPWFDQPGGGTAYLLADAVGDLVAHGHLVEVPGRERPS